MVLLKTFFFKKKPKALAFTWKEMGIYPILGFRLG